MAPVSPRNSEFNRNSSRAGAVSDMPLDETGQTLLHVSVRKRDVVTVARLLKNGANPDQPDAEGQSPLFAAVATRDIVLVRMLTEKGARFRTEDNAGFTPLSWAIKNNADPAFLEELRTLGADLNFRSKNGQGALQAAAAVDNTDILGYLLKNKLEIDGADAAGKTALHYALETGAHAAAQLLLDHGADPVALTGEAKSPIYIAAARGDGKAVDLLLAQPEVRRTLNSFCTTADGFSPLMAAAAGNHLSIAEKMINIGANVNQCDKLNRHSLFIAVEEGHAQMAALLISRGADVEKAARRADTNQTMLHKINTNHYGEILTMLYRNGMELNATDARGKTPLCAAAEMCETVKVKALLELGAKTELANGDGRRPIDAALLAASSAFFVPPIEAYGTVEALLKAGASPNLAAVPNALPLPPPLHLAVRAGRDMLAKLLLKHGANIEEQESITGLTAWLEAVRVRNLDACEALRQAGADTMKKSKNERGVLHIAAQSGAYKILEEALKNPVLRAQVNRPDADGNRPVHAAAIFQNAESARLLINAGADPLAYDGRGLTLLHLAVNSYSEVMIALLETILTKKSDWNVLSRDGNETPLHLAARNGYLGTVNRLLKLDVDVTLKDRRGFTPLLAAAASDRQPIIVLLAEYMKQKKLPLDEPRDPSGWAPLHFTAQRWAPNGLQALLANGADPNIRTLEGDVPLHIAARSGRLESVRALVASGADTTLVNNVGASALDLARDAGQQEIVDLLTRVAKEQQRLKAPPSPPPSPPPTAGTKRPPASRP